MENAKYKPFNTNILMRARCLFKLQSYKILNKGLLPLGLCTKKITILLTNTGSESLYNLLTDSTWQESARRTAPSPPPS